MELNKIIHGDCLSVLRKLPPKSVNCCVTSPPYWGLRDYGVEGQVGLEATPEEYTSKMVEIFGEVRRVLRGDGTLWLNLGDSYVSARGRYTQKEQTLAGGGFNDEKFGQIQYGGRRDLKGHATLKDKDLAGVPWRVAFALQADGWYLRSDIIWHKPNPMPESITDRPTKSHEYIFLMSKSPKYYYDAEAIMEPCVTVENRPFGIHRDRLFNYDSKEKQLRGKGKQAFSYNTNKPDKAWEPSENRNKRDVWTVQTSPLKEAHFATFPPKLIEPCILAGCPEGGTVLDPFIGAGTTGLVAAKHKRNWLGIELNPEYIKIALDRIKNYQICLFET